MWYTANLLFKAVHLNRPEEESVWEERIVLLKAQDESEARRLGESLGKEGEHEYYVSRPEGHLLKWTFVQVQKIFSVDETILCSGTELFSRFLRQSEVDGLLRPFSEDE